MIWSDNTIRKWSSIIEPFNDEMVQPNSYDVTLEDGIYVNDAYYKLPYSIKHDDFILASTQETISLPNGVVAILEGKSTLARKGLFIHSAGFIDAGFQGQITLEMSCVSRPIELTEGMRIGQLLFYDAYQSDKIYGECDNHYQHQKHATKAWR